MKAKTLNIPASRYGVLIVTLIAVLFGSSSINAIDNNDTVIRFVKTDILLKENTLSSDKLTDVEQHQKNYQESIEINKARAIAKAKAEAEAKAKAEAEAKAQEEAARLEVERQEAIRAEAEAAQAKIAQAVYSYNTGALNPFSGVVYFNGHRETYYSQKVLPGTALAIPGRHVESDGTIRDSEGYICVASSDLAKGTLVLTSLGMGKVYDSGCPSGTIDVYTNW